MPGNDCPTATSRPAVIGVKASLRLLGVLAVCVVSVAGTPQSGAPIDRIARLDRLFSLPASTHNSELRADRIGSADLFRFWINSNEDDTRLYTPAGAQMDADFQVLAESRAGQWPDVVQVRLESRGHLVPGAGDALVTLHADGRPTVLRQSADAPARSGPLLFLSARIEMSFDEWLGLVTARTVEGRAWDVPFRLLDAQLELLRAWTQSMGERSQVQQATGT